MQVIYVHDLLCSRRPNPSGSSPAPQQNTLAGLLCPLASVFPGCHRSFPSNLPATAYCFILDLSSSYHILLTQGPLLPGQQVRWRQSQLLRCSLQSHSQLCREILQTTRRDLPVLACLIPNRSQRPLLQPSLPPSHLSILPAGIPCKHRS